MCGLRTRPRMDVNPLRFFRSNCHDAIGGGISSRRPRGDTLLTSVKFVVFSFSFFCTGYWRIWVLRVLTARAPSRGNKHSVSPLLVQQCLNGRAPPYLSEHCIPVSSVDTRRHLRSANRHLLALAVPSTAVLSYMARWPGTHSRILSVIQRSAQTV